MPDESPPCAPVDDLRCPACTAPGLQSDRGGFHCDHCGTAFHVQPVRCPVCGWENPRRSELCGNCGEPLSMVARVLTRQGGGPPPWLGRVRGQAGVLQEQEARASEDRIEQLWDVDRRRRQDDARVLAQQRAAERQVVLVIGIALGVLGLVVVLAMIVLAAQGG